MNIFGCHRSRHAASGKKFPPFRLSALPRGRRQPSSPVGPTCGRPRPTNQISEDAHSAPLPAFRSSSLTRRPSPLTDGPSGLRHRSAALTPPTSLLTRRPSALTSRPSLPTPRPSVLTRRSSLPTGRPSVLTRRPSVLTSRPLAPKSGLFALPRPFSPLPRPA